VLLAICIPAHGDTKADFTLSLSRMLLKTAATNATQRLALQVFIRGGSVLPAVRAELVADARSIKADYILWLDSDMTFSPDILTRFLARRLPIVAANAVRRTAPHLPTTGALDGAPAVWTTRAKAEADAIEEVALIGLGACLIEMRALDALDWPLFAFEPQSEGVYEGEDRFLSKKLRAAGFKLHIDHGVSGTVGHIGQRTYYNSDAPFQR
jgi:hypothetical protein